MGKSRGLKTAVILIVVGVLLLPLGYRGLLALGDRVNGYLLKAVRFHEGSATVTGKEVVRFDETNNSYTNDYGDRVDAQAGDTQFRVYYTYDDFNGYDERFRTQLMEAEKKRVSEGRPRFAWKNYNDRTWYDTVKVGDKLIVTYRAYSDGYIEVVAVRKAEH